MMTEQEFLDLVQLRKEGRHLEFKQSTPWRDAEFKAKLVKSILAFSNVRDGGAIVIGVTELDDGVFDLTGMEEAHEDTYDEDTIKSVVAEYADPYAVVHLDSATHRDLTFLVLTISEFDRIPVICKRDGTANLQSGRIYTRPYGIPQSIAVPTQTELREILDMATEKGIREFATRLHGLDLFQPREPSPSDDDKFDAQLQDL